jgi:hypothetical protein
MESNADVSEILDAKDRSKHILRAVIKDEDLPHWRACRSGSR